MKVRSDTCGVSMDTCEVRSVAWKVSSDTWEMRSETFNVRSDTCEVSRFILREPRSALSKSSLILSGATLILRKCRSVVSGACSAPHKCRLILRKCPLIYSAPCVAPSCPCSAPRRRRLILSSAHLVAIDARLRLFLSRSVSTGLSLILPKPPLRLPGLTLILRKCRLMISDRCPVSSVRSLVRFSPLPLLSDPFFMKHHFRAVVSARRATPALLNIAAPHPGRDASH